MAYETCANYIDATKAVVAFATGSPRGSDGACQSASQAIRIRVRFPVGVSPTGPEEPAQSVAASTRHDVHVEVRHALTHDVVVGDERAAGVERLRHDRGDRLHTREVRTDLARLEFGE